MKHSLFIEVLSWVAVAVLSVSYWFQIWKIHVHKEVRDLSLIYHVLLAIGFGILTYTAYEEHSLIFLVKQIATTVPVIIIIVQIFLHQRDRWHDDELPLCSSCETELEQGWQFCPCCGIASTKVEVAPEDGVTA